MTVRRLVLAACCALMVPLIGFLSLDHLFPFPWDALEREPVTVVTDRDGAPLRFFLPADDTWRLPVARSELPDDLVTAVVAAEDRFFYRHPGIDPVAVLRAASSNLLAGRVVSGASTIPMQIARMVEPSPRTFGAKVREGFRALQLDHHLSKDRLLELYLNLAPYGSNIEGVGAASWFYFGKQPGQLALGEIALLAVLPRSPVGLDPTLHPDGARAAADDLLDRLEQRGVFPRDRVAAAHRVPIPASRRRQPWEAPHFAELVSRGAGTFGSATTTLDLEIERLVEQQVDGRIGSLRDEGIGNVAAVVIEIDSRSVRALVGSADYLDGRSDGQVNGAVARRSPGSTLKPFLYAMALDTGAVLPDGYLLDIPTDFAGYVPENYDGTYRGRVPARSALARSLNAPAVRLLSRVGLGRFVALLRRGGLETLDRPAAEYGLPLILGSGETTLLALTNLYASLAAGGVHRPPRLLESAAPAEGGRLLSREAAWLVTEMLMEVERPDLPAAWDLTRGVPGVAWKTGTSYGHRDAWAIGFSRRYAVGVWVGNFDGTPRKGISGSEHAAPLLFDVIRSIEPGGVSPERPIGLTIESIHLCTESRELPGPFCPKTRVFPYLPGSSILKHCTVHRRVPIDRATGERLTADCGDRAFEWQPVTVYPAELVAWRRAQGEGGPDLPPVARGCSAAGVGEAPRIVSPDASTPYRLRRDAPEDYQRIALVARAGPDAKRLYWYQDGMLLGSARPGESLFLKPGKGRHRITVTDDLGRTDGLALVVE